MTAVERILRFAQAVRHLPANAAATRDLAERLAADTPTASPDGPTTASAELALPGDERHLDDLARCSIRCVPTVPGTTVATTTDGDVGPAVARARAVAGTGDAPTYVLVLAPGCLGRGDDRFEQLDDTSEVLRTPEPLGRRRAALLLAAGARTSHVIVLDADVEPTPGAGRLLLDGLATGADLVRGHISTTGEDGRRRPAPGTTFVAVSVSAVHACLAARHWSALVDRPLDEALSAAGRSVLTIPRLVGMVRWPAAM